MSKELVSVILPCYNVQEYVERAIDSVVNQTYSNIEVVAVNDGSTDDTLAVLDNLRTRFANLVVINQKNQGYGTAVQTGINHAKGTYVVILEPDDYWDNYYLEPLVSEADGMAADAVFYNSYFETRDNFKKTLINQYFHGRYLASSKLSLEEMKTRLVSGAVGICFGLYRKDFLISKKIEMDQYSRAYEDVPFIARIFTSSRNICLIIGGGYNYSRDIPNQSVTNPKRFQSIIKVVEAFYSSCVVPQDISPAINGYFVKHLITYFWKANSYEFGELQNLIIQLISKICRNSSVETTSAISNFIKSRCPDLSSRIMVREDKSVYSNVPTFAEAIKVNRVSTFFSFSKWKLAVIRQNWPNINNIVFDLYPLLATPGVQNLDFYREFLKGFFENYDHSAMVKANPSLFSKLLCDGSKFKFLNNPVDYLSSQSDMDSLREVPEIPYLISRCPSETIRCAINLYSGMEKKREKFNEFISGKTVAVVGNSPCELNLNKGAQIDDHDIVIRFNNFSSAPEFKKDYGTKCNVWAITPTIESLRYRESLTSFDYILLPLSNRYISMSRYKFLENISISGANLATFPTEKCLTDCNMRVVSLGMLTLNYIINNCTPAKIDIYGFNLSEQLQGVSHYFSNDPSRGKLLKFHDWIREALFLNKYIEMGVINHA